MYSHQPILRSSTLLPAFVNDQEVATFFFDNRVCVYRLWLKHTFISYITVW